MGGVALLGEIGNTGCGMEEKNQAEPPQRYIWPWFVLGGVVLGIVLAVFWMTVLVHRVREQRETDHWPAAKQPAPAQSITTPPVSTQSVPVVPVPRTNSPVPQAQADPVQK
jgi:hypothetical protein